jgi:hypothetical protein
MPAWIFAWKVRLSLKRPTGEVENDYVAEVSSTEKTLCNEDIGCNICPAGQIVR